MNSNKVETIIYCWHAQCWNVVWKVAPELQRAQPCCEPKTSPPSIAFEQIEFKRFSLSKQVECYTWWFNAKLCAWKVVLAPIAGVCVSGCIRQCASLTTFPVLCMSLGHWILSLSKTTICPTWVGLCCSLGAAKQAWQTQVGICCKKHCKEGIYVRNPPTLYHARRTTQSDVPLAHLRTLHGGEPINRRHFWCDVMCVHTER